MTDEAPDATETAGTEQETTPEKTFTQSELDAIVKDRLARQKGQFSDYAELKQFRADAEKARLANLSEAEQKIEQAKIEARQDALREYAEKLAAAEIKAALSPILDNSDEIVADLNLRKYVTEDGSVDSEAVAALKSKYEKLLGKRRQSSGTGHGRKDQTLPSTSEEAFADWFEDLNKVK